MKYRLEKLKEELESHRIAYENKQKEYLEYKKEYYEKLYCKEQYIEKLGFGKLLCDLTFYIGQDIKNVFPRALTKQKYSGVHIGTYCSVKNLDDLEKNEEPINESCFTINCKDE